MITVDQLAQIMPLAKRTDLEKNCNPLNAAMPKFLINTPKRIAAFIAQLAHESGNLSASVENLNYSAGGLRRMWPKRFPGNWPELYEHRPEVIANIAYANRMGNGPATSGEGWKYKGRGPIGITGKDNYAICGKAIGLDLINQPELLEETKNGVLAAAWFWGWRGLNPLADIGEFKTITQRINGGQTGAESREAFWNTAKQVIV